MEFNCRWWVEIGPSSFMGCDFVSMQWHLNPVNSRESVTYFLKEKYWTAQML